MTRATLAIDEAVLKRIEEKAASEGRTFEEVANDLLKQALAVPPPPERRKLRLRGWTAETRPGVDLLDRDKLLDLIDSR
jgi:hypothetical protein